MSRAAPNVASLLDDLNDHAVNQVAISDITVEDGFNPRRLLGGQDFTDDALSALAENIRTYGVLQPLLVRRKRSVVVLIAGERRLRAARLAGLTSVPVVFLDVNDERAYELAVVENAQRRDLDLVTETLVGFDLLGRTLGLSVPEVVSYLNAVRNGAPDERGAEALLRRLYGTGVTTWALRRAAILKMTSAEHDAIRRGVIDAKVCAELVHLPDGERRTRLLEQAVTDKLSAAQLRQLARAPLTAGVPTVRTRLAHLTRTLPRLARLKGDKARQAERLIDDLERQLNALLGD